ncbi:glycoside hydrolase [Rathayibacter sp. VKM Ac-2856]|uniref:glycoside hydrolase n=1 Tax=unclassified Rathayibacter TaxID=2609250 RepID=UPI001565F130|nr:MULTISPECIES: glycoside hydrolase [unclassified Rathayibacter]NQX03443.1 glycoside hydrolase [Rathayibacter sp. VKM Ac-2858]NQX18611.1 glycoside hydrolase [Rathayibacter sp. VKM Ac-2856]
MTEPVPLREDAFAEPYRDPVFDGPTDPVLVADTLRGEWLLFYTQRRATLDLPGVEWVHGSAIGLAASRDGGASWEYRGTVPGLDAGLTAELPTLWAPDVVRLGDRWQMFLTRIDGIPGDWTGRATIAQFESEDLRTWRLLGEIDLGSDRVIDAAVARTGDGRYRLFAKDERRDSTTVVAVSDEPGDPASWRVEGVAVSGRAHEGPKVLALGGRYWLVTDEWRGLAVHHSPDGVGGWQRQRERAGLILTAPERLDGAPVVARHADVVALGEDRALIVYFTHPGWDGSELASMPPTAARRRSHVRAAVLSVVDGVLVRSAD